MWSILADCTNEAGEMVVSSLGLVAATAGIKKKGFDQRTTPSHLTPSPTPDSVIRLKVTIKTRNFKGLNAAVTTKLSDELVNL